MRKHSIIALSLSNLCFFEAWREVLSPQSFSYLYYWKQYPGYAALVALVLSVVTGNQTEFKTTRGGSVAVALAAPR